MISRPPPGSGDLLASPARELDLDPALGQRETERTDREQGGDRVQRLVTRGERELELEPLVAEDEDDPAAALDALERLDALRAEAVDLDVVAVDERFEQRLVGNDRRSALG